MEMRQNGCMGVTVEMWVGGGGYPSNLRQEGRHEGDRFLWGAGGQKFTYFTGNRKEPRIIPLEDPSKLKIR